MSLSLLNKAPAAVKDSEQDISSSNEQAIFLLSGSVFKDLISSFLMPNDLVELLKVSGLSGPFLLGERFCRTHGTTLDIWKEPHHGSRNEQNDDIAFLIWCLEQEAFFTKENNEELPSTNPDCIDCRKARFDGLKKCKRCDEYEPYEDIFTCAGPCKRESCADCHEGMYKCSLCEDEGTYCNDCFFDGNGYFCEGCDSEFCKKCRPEVRCDVCGEGCCQQCSPGFEAFTCSVCNKTFCFDCRANHCCDICNEWFCADCRPGFWCEFCDRQYCCKGHDKDQLTCSRCEHTACSDCLSTFQCQKCLKGYCDECRDGFSCGQCKGEFCGDCQESKFCEICSNTFCIPCKDGFRMGCDWACIDCLRKREGLLDKLKSEQNEAEGNMCANCFLSEDDMEDVKLKQCTNCKTTKYCSRACQKAHWKEHRDQCRSVSEHNSETE